MKQLKIHQLSYYEINIVFISNLKIETIKASVRQEDKRNHRSIFIVILMIMEKLYTIN